MCFLGIRELADIQMYISLFPSSCHTWLNLTLTLYHLIMYWCSTSIFFSFENEYFLDFSLTHTLGLSFKFQNLINQSNDLSIFWNESYEIMISTFMVCEFNQSYGKTKCCLYDYFLIRSDIQTYCFVVIKNSCCWWPNHIDHIPILLETECRQYIVSWYNTAKCLVPSYVIFGRIHLCNVFSLFANKWMAFVSYHVPCNMQKISNLLISLQDFHC